jgi:hypothetical protein
MVFTIMTLVPLLLILGRLGIAKRAGNLNMTKIGAKIYLWMVGNGVCLLIRAIDPRSHADVIPYMVNNIVSNLASAFCLQTLFGLVYSWVTIVNQGGQGNDLAATTRRQRRQNASCWLLWVSATVSPIMEILVQGEGPGSLNGTVMGITAILQSSLTIGYIIISIRAGRNLMATLGSGAAKSSGGKSSSSMTKEQKKILKLLRGTCFLAGAGVLILWFKVIISVGTAVRSFAPCSDGFYWFHPTFYIQNACLWFTIFLLKPAPKIKQMKIYVVGETTKNTITAQRSTIAIS